MRIWHVLAITAMVFGWQVQVVWSQTTGPAVGADRDTTAMEGSKETPDKDKSQDGKDGKDATTQEKTSPDGLGKWFLPLMIGMMILLWFWMGRGRRKQQKRQKEMLATLKKGDRVTSIGGIIGTIVEVKDNEITVKVDESSNVRMKFTRWGVRGIGDAGKAENPGEESKKN